MEDPRSVKGRDGNQIEDCKADVENDAEEKNIGKDTQHFDCHGYLGASERQRDDLFNKQVIDDQHLQPKQSGKQNCQKQVGQGACCGGDCHAPFGIFEVPCVDGDRLCPTDTEEQHTNKADNIDMLERVERQTTQVSCSGIAQLVCRVAVR